MAGAGYKLFNTGDVLTAAQVNTYLNEQTVMVFASSTARTTALSGVLAEGMMSYLQDTNSVEVYNGTSWVALASGDVTEVQAGTGISVASGTGPIPVVTNTMATAINAAGDLIYGTANDTFTRLGIGTAGQVLKVNSGATAPEWGAASSGALTLISTTTFSNVATQSFDNVFTSTYTNYLMICYNIQAATGSIFHGRMRASGTDNTGNSYSSYGLEARTTGSYLAFAGNSGQSAFNFKTADNVRTAIEIKFYGPQLASNTLVDWNNNSMNNEYGFRAHGAHLVATAYDGFTLYANTGNISGTVSIYGISK